MGGLSGFLDKNSNVSVYLLESFPETIKQKVERQNSELIELNSYKKLGEEFASTGPLSGPPKEQSLFMNTKKGLVIITGCAHPGVTKIVEKVKEITRQEIYLVIGGFHLSNAPEKRIKNIISSLREMGVEKTAPCHCSGDRARDIFEKEHKKDFIENGVGKTIELNLNKK